MNAPDGQAQLAEDDLSGGGEMGALLRSFDASRTPLGPAEAWPQSLKTAVRIMLSSRYAMWMAWGPELTFLCNDAYMPTLGVKQAWALGSRADKVWEEIWPDIGPRIETVLKTGTATWDERLLLFLERSGYPEETYHTFSYSPLADDRGTITGMLCVVTEDTERVLGERRLGTLRDLGAQATQAKTTGEACRIAVEVLAQNAKDIPFALLYMRNDDGTSAKLRETSQLARGTGASPHIIDLTRDEPDGWPVGPVIRSGLPIHLDDLPARFGALPGCPWKLSPHEALVLPIRESEARISGALVVGVNPCRALDDDYRGFLELAVRQISTTIGNARAYEDETRRAEALAELDRAKTTFFSNVSHEFRTPLTLMLGPVEDLLERPEGEALPDARALLEVVHRNALRLQKLVNTLLDFSRIESGRVQASYEPTDLACFTAELASVFRSAVEKAGMRLIVACEPLREPVYVDRDMWEKIVLNLVSNAFKFTLEGEIEVTLRQEAGAAVLRVRDTGSGISEEQLPHIFERFHRVEGTRARTEEGTGIGLSLVEELVKLHGGSVTVRSVQGRGTTFTVRVPLGMAHLPVGRIGSARSLATTALGAGHFVTEALKWLGAESGADLPVLDDPVGVPHATGAPGRDGERRRILLADDNADMRDYLTSLLGPRYEVVAVPDGEQALRAARIRRPDLVLTDAMMPVLDGFGLLDALRSDPQTQTVPVIMLSARAGEEARIEGLRSGADDYLIKPFRARELLARVAATIELARVRREAAAANERASNILESITDGFIALDRDWRFTYVNAEAERLNGIRREDLLGRSHWEVFPETVGTAVEREFHRVVAEQAAVEFENYYEPWDRWFELNAYPSKDGGLSVYFRDVTERKRNAAVLNEQKHVLELIARDSRLREVLDALCRMVERHSGNGLLASILILDRDGIHLRHGGAPSLPEDYNRAVDGLAIGLRAGSSGTAAYRREPVFVAEIATDPLWAGYAELALAHGLRACWSQPILSGAGEVLGTFAMYSPSPRHPAPDDLRLVDIVTRTAAIAIERDRAASELRDARARLEAALSAGSIATWAWDLKADRIVADANLARLFSLTSAEAAGGALGCYVRAIHPEDRAQVESAVARAVESGSHYETEYRVVQPGGGVRWVVARGKVERDADGEPTSFPGLVVDITERKRAEEEQKRAAEAAARRSEQLQKLAAVAARINGALDVDSVLGLITAESRALIQAHQAITSLTAGHDWAQAVMSVSFSEKYAPWRDYDAVPDGSGIYSLVCHTNRPLRLTQQELEDHPAYKGLGSEREKHPPIRGWLAAPLVGRSGRNIGIIQLSDKFEGEFTEDDEYILMQLAQMASIAVENARLYQELRENDRRKDEFLAMLAHELRNPLAAISNAAQVAKRTDAPEHRAWSQEVVEAQVKNLSRMIDDLLDVSRITRGKIELRKQHLELTPIVTSAIETARPLLEERRHRLILDLAAEPLPVEGDPTRLEQIVVNLLNNAAKYTESGGRITLTARPEGRDVMIQVDDTGVGMPPELLARAFDLFTQGDRTIARSEGGLGIGLTLVKSLVEMHGGSIRAESEGQGKGSRFTVRLPIAAERTDDLAPGAPAATNAAQQGSRVLIVDDNVDTARGMARLLRLLGHDARLAHDGPSALVEARGQQPDIILLDIGLPGMDGYQVARTLRDEGFLRTMIIAVSGYGEEAAQARSRAAGFDHHMVKPVDVDSLVALIARSR